MRMMMMMMTTTISHKTSQALCTNLKLCDGMRHLAARSRTPNSIEYLFLILLTVHTFLNDDAAADDVDTAVFVSKCHRI